MKRILKPFRPLVVDRNSVPEVVRSVTLLGALVCLVVFLEANIHYIIKPGTDGYDLTKVGELMEKFATSFAWLIGAGGLGIAARSMTDRPRDPDRPEDRPPDKPECGDKP